MWDPVSGLVLSGPTQARDVYVEGRPVVRDGALVGLELPDLLRRAGAATQRLVNGE